MTTLRETGARLLGQFGLGQTRGLFESRYLGSLGFDVKTVIDVGVDRGTRPLYEAFSDRLLVLVDPRRDAELWLRDKPRRYMFVNKALGASPGRLVLRQQEEGKTTLLERTPLTASPITAEYEVDVTTLDALLDLDGVEPPIGIKIDTEGYELEVLRGLNRHWKNVEFVICEASIRRRFINSYQVSELVAFMLDNNFLLFNFLNPVNDRPRYYDLLFVPRTSHLLD